MRYDNFDICLRFGFPNRQYVLRLPDNANKNLTTMTENDIVFTTQDDYNWSESKCLCVLLDGGEQITLQMLKNKQLELNNKEGKKLLRDLRNKLLTDTDYLLMIDYPLTDEKKNEFMIYRQELRDLPSESNPQIDMDGNLDMNSFILPIKPLLENPIPINSTGPTGSIEEVNPTNSTGSTGSIDEVNPTGPTGSIEEVNPIGPTGS